MREDSAFGRARKAAAQGLGPDIPDAEINSRNTAPAWQQEKLLKKNKKKKHRKKKVSNKPQPAVHHDLDNWLTSVDNLKKDLERLKGKLSTPTPPVEKTEKSADVKPKKVFSKETPEEDEEGIEQEKMVKKKPDFKSFKKPEPDFDDDREQPEEDDDN